MATVSRSSTPRGSRTRAVQTQVEEPAPAITTNEPWPVQAVLHLRGAKREAEAEAHVEDDRSVPGNTKSRRRIRWAEGVVDNEGLGRKSSKVCCIYHAPRGIDESSDESSSDSDDSESDGGDDGSARPSRREVHGHTHGHGKGKGKERGRSPNAYEKVPKPKTGGATQKS